MVAKDRFHNIVKSALEREGWTITHDPYFIDIGSRTAYIDIGAGRPIAAQRNDKTIAVEIKSFVAESIANEFHTALGQYLDYEIGLEEKEPSRIIFLAIPHKIYQKLQKIPILIKVLDRYKVNLITFDPTTAEITTWLKT